MRLIAAICPVRAKWYGVRPALSGANFTDYGPCNLVADRQQDASKALARTRRDALMVALYREGTPVLEIAAKAAVCVETVRNVARRTGLPPRIAPKPERDAAIIARYREGERVAKIAEEHGVSQSRVRVVAAREGLPPRTGWQRQYPINHGAFDRPTDVGWWLIGLLAADGSINASENRVSLCQTVDDADVLHAFYAYVGCPDRPLTMLNLSEAAKARQFPRRPAAEARIFSARIVGALGRHGVVPGKSRSMKLGSEASRRAAVWLGLLDGDGSVGIYERGRRPRIMFSGTHAVMKQCERFWRAELDLRIGSPSARPHRGTTWIVSLGGSTARASAHMLLASSPISMRRKRKVLMDIARWSRTSPLSPHQAATIVSSERRK